MGVSWLRLSSVLLVLLLGAPVLADDVSLSTSNAPQGAIEGELDALLGAEHAAMSRLKPENLQRLSTRPKPVLGIFGHRQQFNYTREWLASLPVATGDAQWQCLTEALYFEARGESVKGQFAVAEVIMNRVDSPAFPNTVCKVVHQGTGKRFQCQFTYRCDGRREVIGNRAAWEQVGKVARIMLDGKARDLTDGATHYHTRSVRPRWSRKFLRTTAIGAHYFYRMPVKTASSG